MAESTFEETITSKLKNILIIIFYVCIWRYITK